MKLPTTPYRLSLFGTCAVPTYAQSLIPRWAGALLAGMMAILLGGGCTTLTKPALGPVADGSVPLQGSDSAELYQRIRQAKGQNSIVLQVDGDSEPVRILPLPPDGRAVFVSDLIRQTGIQEKLGRMHVTVYRSSPVDFEGAKMDVRFDDSGDSIRPETDYHLQAGDRIKIFEDSTSSFSRLLDQIVPANASKAIVGR